MNIDVWDRILIVLAVAVLVFTFTAGMFVQDTLLSNWSCIWGQVGSQTLVSQDGRLVTVGEQVLCAKDWKITNVYGPKMPNEYRFKDWTPNEEWMPWNWLRGDKGDEL